MQDQSAEYLQTMIGTVADGGIGPNTLAKLKEYVDEHGLRNVLKTIKVKDKNIMRS